MGFVPLPDPEIPRLVVRHDPYSRDVLIDIGTKRFVISNIGRIRYGAQEANIRLASEMLKQGLTWQEMSKALMEASRVFHELSPNRFRQVSEVSIPKQITIHNPPQFRLKPRLRAFRRFSAIILYHCWKDIQHVFKAYREDRKFWKAYRKECWGAEDPGPG